MRFTIVLGVVVITWMLPFSGSGTLPRSRITQEFSSLQYAFTWGCRCKVCPARVSHPVLQQVGL